MKVTEESLKQFYLDSIFPMIRIGESHFLKLNQLQELKKYKWKTDMNGKIIDKEPVKADDHLLDAMRYAIFTRTKTPKVTWGVI